MWRASSDDQTFSGSFGALLATVVNTLLDDYECFPDELRGGYVAFDCLTFSQKIVVIQETIFAILCEDVSKPELYAYNEAFVAGLCEMLRFVDLDFIDLDEMLDMPPQRRDAVEDVVRFGNDYFTAFPDDPSDKETKKLLREVHDFLDKYLK